MSIVEILLIVAVFGFLFFLVGGQNIRKMLGGGKNHQGIPENAQELEQVVHEALRQLNCDVAWLDENDARVAQYDYQNGHFRLQVSKKSPYVRLSYLFCLSTSFDHLDMVRLACNTCNINSENQRIVYSINEEKNEVDLHVLSGLLLHPDNAKMALAHAMAASFSWQNALGNKMSEMEEQVKGKQDLEADEAAGKREVFLLRQQEMRLQGNELRYNDVHHLTLSQLLDKAMGLTDIVAHRLEVMGTDRKVIEDSQAIMDYDLNDWMAAGHKEVSVATLHAELPSMPEVERIITLTLNPEGDDGQSAYFRVTVCLVPLSVNQHHSYRMNEHAPMACSLLMAYDRTSRQQQINESNYMWKEAVQKMKMNQKDQLSEEQKLLANCTTSDLAFLCYHGRKKMLAGRYYEALLLLENVYLILQPDFDTLTENQREAFYEVIYEIGFCYCELHQYIRAQAYLGMLAHLNRISFTIEWLNSMVNSGNFRSLYTITDIKQSIENNLAAAEQEPNEHLKSFLSFLDRRKVYVMVDKGKLEEAKTLLGKMLNDPENVDFAINELAYIQKLEKENH